MIRLMLMPFLSASRLTVPVTLASSIRSPPDFIRNRTGSRKFEMPTCWIARFAPRISDAGPFCKSGSVAL